MTVFEGDVFHFEPTAYEKNAAKTTGKRAIGNAFRVKVNAFLHPPNGLCNNDRIHNAQRMIEYAMQHNLEIPKEAKEHLLIQVLLLGYERNTINHHQKHEIYV